MNEKPPPNCELRPSTQPPAGTPLNVHGDVLVKTTGSHGPDISSQRMDELDHETLRYALSLSNLRLANALDVGCGFGAQSRRLAELGLSVLMVDLEDRRETAFQINSLVGGTLAKAYYGDIRTISDAELPSNLHLFYSQRTLHYMSFEDAHRVLTRIAQRMEQGTKAFISMASMTSELANGYDGTGIDIAKRLFSLSRELAEKHSIFEPLCLYWKDEFAHLLETSGFAVERITRSEFGALKGIFKRL